MLHRIIDRRYIGGDGFESCNMNWKPFFLVARVSETRPSSLSVPHRRFGGLEKNIKFNGS